MAGTTLGGMQAAAATPTSPPDHSGAGPRVGLGWVLRATLAVLVRPGLWATAVHQIAVLARTGWWRRPPFLPLPDPAYLRFRLQTAYGGAGHDPDAHDVVTYLHWCRAWPRVTGRVD